MNTTPTPDDLRAELERLDAEATAEARDLSPSAMKRAFDRVDRRKQIRAKLAEIAASEEIAQGWTKPCPGCSACDPILWKMNDWPWTNLCNGVGSLPSNTIPADKPCPHNEVGLYIRPGGECVWECHDCPQRFVPVGAPASEEPSPAAVAELVEAAREFVRASDTGAGEVTWRRNRRRLEAAIRGVEGR